MSRFLFAAIFICTAVRLFAAPSAITNHALNVYNPLVLNGSRCTGMAGSVVALGDEADDIFYNCAATSVRNAYQTNNFEWDYSIFFANVFSKEDIDFRNAREVVPDYAPQDFQYSALALLFMYKRWGFSFTFITSSLLMQNPDNTVLPQYELNEMHIQFSFSYALVPDILSAGIGVSIPGIEIRDAADEVLVKFDYQEESNPNIILGSILRIPESGLSLGASLLFNNSGTINLSGESVVSGIPLPAEVRYPTLITVGGAWKIDLFDVPRKLRSRKLFTTKSLNFKPEYILFSFSLRYVDTVAKAVDMLSYTSDSTLFYSGEKEMLEPALGMEITFPEWLKIRVGSYYEGARIRNTSGRFHLTLNTELSLFSLFGFDLAGALTADIAREFWSIGLSVKVWRY